MTAHQDREERLRLGVVADARVLGGPDDADDLDWRLRSWIRPEADVSADRVVSVEVLLHEELVDDHETRRALARRQDGWVPGDIAVGEVTSEQERNAQRREIPGHDPVVVRLGLLTILRCVAL